MTILGENLEQIAYKYGLTYREIARRTGVLPSTLTRIVSKGISARSGTVAAIAKAFGYDPWELQTKPLAQIDEGFRHENSWSLQANGTTSEGTEPVVARWNEEDVRIRDTDLNNYARLRELSRKASDVEWPGPHVVGSLLLTMPTDELSPVTPRGATLYITVEADQFHPDAANGEEAIGIIDSEEDGLGQYTFGRLTMAQGRMFITPTNPTMATPVEVKRVTARVAGWVVIRQKQP